MLSLAHKRTADKLKFKTFQLPRTNLFWHTFRKIRCRSTVGIWTASCQFPRRLTTGARKGSRPRLRAPEEILLDAVDVSIRLKVSEDWVWDHSSRRAPFLPAIWLSDGVVRFKPSKIDEFIDERERLSTKRRRRR